MSNKPKVIAIVGPTASGKTAMAIAIAKKIGGEIVSADSRQIYRGMDIGTAKPSAGEQREIPHHLIDIKDPDEDYTVADYKADATAAIEKIITRGTLPLLVGGTGLYVKAVLENLDIPKAVAHPELRAKIERDIAKDGLATVFERLVALDPEAAYVVDPKNPRRVVRALEVAIATGEPFTAQRKKNDPLFDTLVIGLNPPPELLRKRIDQRVDMMMREGLVGEVKSLVKKYGATPVAFDAIGYREIIAHLSGTLTLDEATVAIKMNTWHFAKRQMTWFKKDKDVRWIENEQKAIALVGSFLNER
jgi:tRNA dimethylallyltransferase